MHYIHKFKRSSIEKIVGWFVIFSVLAVIAVLVGVGIRNNMFKKEYHLIAVIREGYGLRSGTPVKLAGIEVGEVADIGFSEDNRIKVTMTINRKFQGRIRKDSKSLISSAGLVGDKFINITVGGSSALPLADGDIIPMIEPVEIGDLGTRLNTIIEQVENVLTETYQIAHKVNSSSVGELDAALKNVRQISATVKDSKLLSLANDEEAYNSVKGSMSKLNATMDNLKKSSDNIPGIVKNVDTITVEANKVVKALQKHWLIRAYIKEDNADSSAVVVSTPSPSENSAGHEGKSKSVGK